MSKVINIQNIQLDTLVIDDVTYFVKYGVLSSIKFGQITGKNAREIRDMQSATFEDQIKLLYSGIQAGCEIKKVPCLSFDDFVIALDTDETLLERLNTLKTGTDSATTEVRGN